jgi:predicted TIM-barrel fold metal-dependent hydrolase
MDAYCHLDMDLEVKRQSPIADIGQRMSTADVSSALLVETWDGRNRRLLNGVLRKHRAGRFGVALCYRQDSFGELRRQLSERGLTAVRMSTQDIRRDASVCEDIYRAGKVLLTHAETGIGSLCRELSRIMAVMPELRVYVPHLGWPVAQGKADFDWEGAVRELATLPSVTFGVSAIAHFSREPFPHNDVRDFALRVISQVGASRIAIGSDYPLFDKARYADYMFLARDWVASIHPDWSFTF